MSGRTTRPCVAVLGPAGWGILEFLWAADLLVVNAGVVPAKGVEIVAAVPEGRILEPVAVTALVGILTVYHPVTTGLRALESLFTLPLIARVADRRIGIVEAGR